jgi:hypothetical protein
MEALYLGLLLCWFAEGYGIIYVFGVGYVFGTLLFRQFFLIEIFLRLSAIDVEHMHSEEIFFVSLQRLLIKLHFFQKHLILSHMPTTFLGLASFFLLALVIPMTTSPLKQHFTVTRQQL